MLTPHSIRERKRAFSLVEVAFALSIVSFACLTLLGLLGNGLVTVNRAIGTTVQGEIIQSIINESQVHTYNSGYATSMYFNDQGTAVSASDPSQIYTATLTAVPLQVGGSSGYTLNAANSGSMLKVAIVSKSRPGVTNSFSLVWCNSK